MQTTADEPRDRSCRCKLGAVTSRRGSRLSDPRGADLIGPHHDTRGEISDDVMKTGGPDDDTGNHGDDSAGTETVGTCAPVKAVNNNRPIN